MRLTSIDYTLWEVADGLNEEQIMGEMYLGKVPFPDSVEQIKGQ